MQRQQLVQVQIVTLHDDLVTGALSTHFSFSAGAVADFVPQLADILDLILQNGVLGQTQHQSAVGGGGLKAGHNALTL